MTTGRMLAMDVAALLLTGGSSRRMGRDKAGLAGVDGRPLAARTAALLRSVAAPVLEMGPGRSGAAALGDAEPGAGALVAVATGVAALRRRGWSGGALVVGTDLPLLDLRLLRWLAGHPAPGTVVPLVDGDLQLLCARYDAGILDCAADLVAAGHRAMRALVDGRPVHLAGPDEWQPVSPDGSLADADTPGELAALLRRGRDPLGRPGPAAASDSAPELGAAAARGAAEASA